MTTCVGDAVLAVEHLRGVLDVVVPLAVVGVGAVGLLAYHGLRVAGERLAGCWWVRESIATAAAFAGVKLDGYKKRAANR